MRTLQPEGGQGVAPAGRGIRAALCGAIAGVKGGDGGSCLQPGQHCVRSGTSGFALPVALPALLCARVRDQVCLHCAGSSSRGSAGCRGSQPGAVAVLRSPAAFRTGSGSGRHIGTTNSQPKVKEAGRRRRTPWSPPGRPPTRKGAGPGMEVLTGWLRPVPAVMAREPEPHRPLFPPRWTARGPDYGTPR